ncbi:MAG: DnaJ domain-containing protein, partial [Candidatus Eremiobacterota bacterium]
MADRDPYRVMGVPPISTESEIKKAYRSKSKEYHPDLNPDLRIWADEKMKELVEAYNVLSDEE